MSSPITDSGTTIPAFSLDWMRTLISSIPASVPVRRNIFDIAGFPSWENVCSNLLAFYLDETEQHGMGRLFFNALLKTIEEADPSVQSEEYELAFDIFRERERIDILLQSKELAEPGVNLWAILIENKIYHTLQNDLWSYWQRVKAKHKTGIVLSLDPVDQQLLTVSKNGVTVTYLNITHQQLLSNVKQLLPDYYLESDDRHLLYLKDFIHNIEDHYTMHTPQAATEQTLLQFQGYYSEIKQFQALETKLKDYLIQNVYAAFEKIGFKPYTLSTATWSKHFYHDPSFYPDLPVLSAFRFYVDFQALLYGSEMNIYYELYDHTNTAKGPELKQVLLQKELYKDPDLQPGTAGGAKYSYYHIAMITKAKLHFTPGTLAQTLEKILEHSFAHTERNFIRIAADEFSKL